MAKINRRYTFTIIRDVYKETKTASGIPIYKLIKKNAKWEVDFYLNDIVGVGHAINSRGNVRKGVCEIFHKDKGDYVVLGNKAEISKIVFDEVEHDNTIGFNSKNK